MEYILVQHEGFKEEYLNQIKLLEGVSSDELVRRYNKEVDTGIVGVSVHRISLSRTFLTHPYCSSSYLHSLILRAYLLDKRHSLTSCSLLGLHWVRLDRLLMR